MKLIRSECENGHASEGWAAAGQPIGVSPVCYVITGYIGPENQHAVTCGARVRTTVRDVVLGEPVHLSPEERWQTFR